MGSNKLWIATCVTLLVSACYGAPDIDSADITHPTSTPGPIGGGDPNNTNSTTATGGTGGTGGNGTTTAFHFQTSQTWGTQLTGSAWANGDATPRFVADFNGDGNADLAAMDGNNTYLALSTGTSFAQPLTSINDYPYSRAWTSQNTMPRVAGDVNGDHAIDFVGFGGGVWIDNGQPGGFIADSTSWTTDFSSGDWTDLNSAPRFMGDVNGDGKADVIGVDASGVHVGISNGTSFAAQVLWSQDFVASNGWTSQDATPRMVADFNGDGKADIIGFGTTGVLVGLSDGTSFKSVTVSTDFVGGNWVSQNTTPRFAGDVDGDGKADLIGIDSAGVHVAFSQGETAGAASLAFTGFGPNNGWASQNATPRFIADVNGDKKTDLVGFASDSIWVVLAP